MVKSGAWWRSRYATLVNDLSTQVQIPAQTGVLLIERYHLISLMSFVKSSRSSERDKVRDLLAQWLSAVG